MLLLCGCWTLCADAHGRRKQHRAIRQQHWAIQHGYHVTEPDYSERIAEHDAGHLSDQSNCRQSEQHDAAGHDSRSDSESEPDSGNESELDAKHESEHRSQHESGRDAGFAVGSMPESGESVSTVRMLRRT